MDQAHHRFGCLPVLIACCMFSVIAATVSAQNIHLDIDDALLRAVQSSDELKYAHLEYRYDVARYRLSLREFLPDITLGYTQDDTVAYYAPDSHLKRLSLGIDQLLYAGGSRFLQRRSMANQLQIHHLSIEEMEKNLRLEIVNRYVEILKLGLQIRILEKNLSQAREQVLIAQEELNVGEITRLDYLDIALAVQDLEIELGVLKQEEELLKFELKELLSLDPLLSLELAGTINPAFQGMLPFEEVRYYIECILIHSLELRQRTAEISILQGAVKQARRNWLPRVSTQVELSAAGKQFPLTTPGFSLGLNLDFATPGLPFRTGFSAGSRVQEERSFGFSSSADVGENLTDWHTLRTASIELRKSETELQKTRRALEYAVRQQLKRRSFILDNLLLEHQRLELQAQRHSLEAIMLEVGDITRLEYLQSGIELARQRVDHLSRVVTLFQLETALLAQCGSDLLERCHEYILITGSDQ